MTETGWIKLHRSFLDWEWYCDINTKILALHVLLKSNYEDKKWRGRTILRGQLVTSISSLSKETSLTPKQIIRACKNLEECGFWGRQTTNKYTILTICNYDTYQNTEDVNLEKRANKGQTKGKQRATTKEIKKIRNKEEYIICNNNSSKSDANSEIDEGSNNPPKNSKIEKEKSCVKKEKETLDQRQEEFRQELTPYVDTYGELMIQSFYDYWSEPTQGNAPKMKKELQRTWATASRLRTWKSNETKFNDTTNRRTNQRGATPEGIANAIQQGIGRAVYNKQQREAPDSSNE